MLAIKGLNSNKLIDINKINYLVFSFTDEKFSLSKNKIGDNSEKDIFYSLSLVTRSDIFKNKEQSNSLYEKIICNLKKNYSLIKEGGILEIYYVTSSNLENEIEEGYRPIYNGFNYKSLIPSINEIITLNDGINNNILEVKIYIFSYDTFFKEFLTSNYKIFPEKINYNYIFPNKRVIDNRKL